MNAALIDYKKLAKCLKSWDYKMNPYDPCVWNKIVLGTQLTLIFHADDALMSHALLSVVTEHMKLLDEGHGENDPLTVTRGKIHEHLGMTLDFRTKGSVAFAQYDATKKYWCSLPTELRGEYKSVPVPENLFKVDEDLPRIDAKLKNDYHTATAKCLHFSQRSRTDIQLATGFHCTRAKATTEQDVCKFRHLSGHLWLTRFLPLIISIDSDREAHTFIDRAHAVHADGRGHSGMHLTMGKGAMMNVLKKLGLVTTSLTETEVVSNGEWFPKCSWFRYFRLA